MGIFSKIFNSNNNEFAGISFGDDFNLFEREDSAHKKFLGRYVEKDIQALFNKCGLAQFFKDKKILKYILKLKVDDTMIHHLDVYNDEEKEANKIIDLRISESRFSPSESLRKGLLANMTYDMIVIEWLATRNPEKKKFSKEKPQLPGQKNPTLGSLKYLMALMYHVAKESTKDGFLDVPDHIHLALMYMKEFKFLDPQKEGFVHAVRRDLKNFSLYQISMADITNCIRTRKDGNVAKYSPGEQIFPVSRRMVKYFNSSAYKSKVKEYEKIKLFIDEKELEKNTMEILENKKIAEL